MYNYIFQLRFIKIRINKTFKIFHEKTIREVAGQFQNWFQEHGLSFIQE